MCHDDDVSTEQSAENDRYVDFIADLDPGLVKYLAAQDRIAVALRDLRRELVFLGNHLVNLISAV